MGVRLKGRGAGRELEFHVVLCKQLHKEVDVTASASSSLVWA